ncbi:unnamed protein product [Dovyalis caffra]|uniref:Exonuclease domain-containing protein n=1 Tax=Dovyalis caffra TaxID=77055 RepID=A0AAV1QUI5_9ROSI|nr:unnamed protein product [Dovyalis caffra]
MSFPRVPPLSRIPSYLNKSNNFHLHHTHFIPISKSQQQPTNQTVRSLTNFNVPIQSQSPSALPSPMPSSPIDNANSTQRIFLIVIAYGNYVVVIQIDDSAHLERFNHDCSKDFQVSAADFERKRPQDFDFFLVLDLEGKVEILEFPVLIIDAKNMGVVDLFHRFVRPTAMSEQRVNEYIHNKYGKFGVDRVWHDTALPFNEVLQKFESWLTQHNLWEKMHGGLLNRAAFQARGMRTMMQQLKIPMVGSHHLGLDDTKNIARVLIRMLADGAVVPITAWRKPEHSSIYQPRLTISLLVKYTSTGVRGTKAKN